MFDSRLYDINVISVFELLFPDIMKRFNVGICHRTKMVSIENLSKLTKILLCFNLITMQIKTTNERESN